jgi:hypothetical protein
LLKKNLIFLKKSYTKIEFRFLFSSQKGNIFIFFIFFFFFVKEGYNNYKNIKRRHSFHTLLHPVFLILILFVYLLHNEGERCVLVSVTYLEKGEHVYKRRKGGRCTSKADVVFTNPCIWGVSSRE